jgi:hypothetical protein
MNDLGEIAIRVMRDGKPISAFVSELEFLTAQELYNLPRHVGEPILAALKADPAWHYDICDDCWKRAAA